MLGRDLHRERVLRSLTFWLRPAFALRVVHRFQRIAGIDRAIALASSALTALIPLVVVSGAVLTHIEVQDLADRIIHRYELTGGGAEAVRDVFSPPGGTSASVDVIGVLLLMVAVLSFTRGVQRLFEQAWELAPLSVRNTLNDLRWAVGFVAYLGARRSAGRPRRTEPRTSAAVTHEAADHRAGSACSAARSGPSRRPPAMRLAMPRRGRARPVCETSSVGGVAVGEC